MFGCQWTVITVDGVEIQTLVQCPNWKECAEK